MTCCVWSPNGRLIIGGSTNGTTFVWDTNTCECIGMYEWEKNHVEIQNRRLSFVITSCAISSDGRYYTDGSSCSINFRLWEVYYMSNQRWQIISLLHLARMKNSPNEECFLSLLPKELIDYLIPFILKMTKPNNYKSHLSYV
jgi:WD40 repeat protein